MKYLLPGVLITMSLTTFAFGFMTRAAYADLKERLGRGKFDRKD